MKFIKCFINKSVKYRKYISIQNSKHCEYDDSDDYGFYSESRIVSSGRIPTEKVVFVESVFVANPIMSKFN